MKKQYIVELTKDERSALREVVRAATASIVTVSPCSLLLLS